MGWNMVGKVSSDMAETLQLDTLQVDILFILIGGQQQLQ